MATVRRWCILSCLLLGAACGKPVGLGAPATPLVQIQVQASGDLPADAAASGEVLHVALVWALQWLPEPFCVLPAASPAVEAVQQAGCRDNFGFVPNRVGADVLIQPGVTASIPLLSLPSADVMVGDLTARIAYASLIVYGDRNGNGVLDLRHPPRQRRGGEPIDDAAGPADVVYGASFVSMTEPDRRVAYREGGFSPQVAFYPRGGCSPDFDPPPGFSILSAGGVSQTGLLLSLLTGQLPSEASCGLSPIGDLVVIPLPGQPTGAASDGSPAPPIDAGASPVNDLSQLACTANDSGGVTGYRRPVESLDLSDPTLVWACADFPRLPGDDAGVPTGQQLVTAQLGQPCRGTLHYTLRGCNTDPGCATPSWDLTDPSLVPSWWPCATSQTTPANPSKQ